MSKKILLSMSMLALALLVGCASPTNMPALDTTYVESEKPVFLMTATLKNNYKPSHTPKLLVVNVERDIVTGKADRLNFKMDKKAKMESDDPHTGNNYLLRMDLEAGNYVIRGLTSQSFSFPIHGMFFAPMHSEVTADGPGIYYLGHVDATVRERQGEEFRAGAVIPLIDQAVAGASGGSFDVEISDQWVTDEQLFKSNFPALANKEVIKAILPQFDRDNAQQWWEENF